MAKTIEVSVDTSDLKVLTTHLNNTKKTIKMTATSAKADFKQLKMAIDPVYRAEKLFTKQVLVAQKALATKAITNKQYSQTFLMIQKNAQAAGMTLNQFGQVANVNTRKMKRFGAVGMQQVGYQVQDFAVQVQGGTNVMVALGQQGSQLLGIFGPYGAIAGMILAIGTGLAGAFMAAKKAGDATTNSLTTYSQSIKDARASTKQLRIENYKLSGSFKSVELAQLDMQKKALEEKLAEAKTKPETGSYGDMKSTGSQVVDMIFGKGKGLNIAGFQIIDSLETKLKNVIAEIKKAEDALGESEGYTEEDRIKELNKSRKDLIKTLIAQNDAQLTIGSSVGRELLQNQQINDLRKLKVQLADLELQSDSKIYQEAIKIKLNEQESVLIAYDIAQAERDRLQTIKDMQVEYEKRKAKQKEAHEAAKLAAADLINLNKAIGSSMDNAMMSMVDGTKSVKDAFKDMAREIIKELYRIYVVKKITGMITGAIEGKFAPDIAATKPMANGGPVSAGGRYIVGERGPEVFTPAMSGTITPNSGGGGGSGTTIVQNINVSTGVQQTVRAEIRQMMPQIADSAKGAVLDAKRRGGSYGRAMA